MLQNLEWNLGCVRLQVEHTDLQKVAKQEFHIMPLESFYLSVYVEIKHYVFHDFYQLDLHNKTCFVSQLCKK